MNKPPVISPPSSPIGTLYREYIESIRSKDLSRLVRHYTPDCLVVTTLTEDRQPRYVRGRDELHRFLGNRLATLGDFSLVHNQWAETEDTLMTVEELQLEAGEPPSLELYDNWCLRDGKIAIHFAGVVRYGDGTYADGTGYPQGKAPPKSEPPDTPLGRMYREHIGFITHKNVDGILNQYDEHALLIGTLTEQRKPRFVRGRDELRKFFEANFMNLKSLTSDIDQWAETENTLMMTESVRATLADGANADMSFSDNWVLRNGRISVHFAGVVRYPDGSYA